MKIMNVFSFSLIVLLLVLPVAAFLGLVSYILWYILNSNSGVRFMVTWQGKPLVTWELQNTAPDWKDMWKQSDNGAENSGW